MDEKNMNPEGINENPSPAEASPAENPIVDYKAELEKAQKELGQAKFTIEKLKKNPSKQKEEENNYGYDDMPTERISEIVKEEIGQIRTELFNEKIESTIIAKSSSKEEADLIRFNFENVIKQTGDIIRDIENAKILANRSVIENRISEVNKALSAKSSTMGGHVAGDAGMEEEPIKLNAAEEAILKRRGLTAKDVK